MKLPGRRVLGATLLTLAGAACGDSTSPDGGDDITLTVVSWGGAYQSAMTDAWFVPYGQANPRITLTQDSPTDYETIQAMVQSGTVTWDVVDVENDFGPPLDVRGRHRGPGRHLARRAPR